MEITSEGGMLIGDYFWMWIGISQLPNKSKNSLIFIDKVIFNTFSENLSVVKTSNTK
jgi:hypothetical protein